ncbi:MAG: DNA replication/repair protein RecF [Lachnospiraceae bacterium]
MIVKSIELYDYRNYHQLKLPLDQGTNIFFGNNAQGKTNILESVFLSATTKSHKGSKDKDIIQFGKSEAHIRTIVDKKGSIYQIDIHLKKNKSKGIAINQVPIRKASDLFGILNIVFFSPEDLNIIKSGPMERRRFIDAELCQLDKIYLSDLSNYNKILNQRNRLLKDMYQKPNLRDSLSVWNDQLINYGKKIILRRNNFIHEINGIVKLIHSQITNEKEDIILRYEPNIGVDDFEKELSMGVERDIRLGQTSIGPHRDDIRFEVNEVDIRKFGSQGQQRTCALSLKLAEIELVKKITGDEPVLMLDDVLSELDAERQNHLLNNIKSIQTLISCTGLDEFIKNRFHINQIFEVIDGNVNTMSSGN